MLKDLAHKLLSFFYILNYLLLIVSLKLLKPKCNKKKHIKLPYVYGEYQVSPFRSVYNSNILVYLIPLASNRLLKLRIQ